jgi:hypothetical protein
MSPVISAALAEWTDSSRDLAPGHASKSAQRALACAKRLRVRVRSTALGRELLAGGCMPRARFEIPSPLHPGGMAACSRWLREPGDRYHRETSPMASTPAGVPAGQSKSFGFSLPSGSLASLRDAMHSPSLPVVSLRSTTGYRLSSLRDGIHPEDSHYLPATFVPSSHGIPMQMMPERGNTFHTTKAVLRTRTPKRFAQGSPREIPSMLESTSHLTRRSGNRQCLMF